MSDDDLIRHGEVRELLQQCGLMGSHPNDPLTVMFNAIPAAQVTVKPLEWFEVEKYRYGGKYTSEGYTIRYIEGFFLLDFAGNGKTVWRFPTLEAAKAAAQADYDARIRSALTVSLHDPEVVEIDLRAVMMEQIEEAAAQSPWVPPEYTMNEVVSDCCSFLREARHDPAKVLALVEAAKRVSFNYHHGNGLEELWAGFDALDAALAAWKEEK